MMHEVKVPVTDVNSEEGVIVEWHVEDGADVRRDQLVAEIETTKAVIDVTATSDGVLAHEYAEGATFDIDATIAMILPDAAALDAYRAERDARRDEVARRRAQHSYRATKGAEEAAERLGIDLGSLAKDGLLTTADVERAAQDATDVGLDELPDLLGGDGADTRVLLIGAGLGATQVLDILDHDDAVAAVGVVDDDRSRWGDEVYGVPVVGGTDRLEALFDDGRFDAAIVAISTSVEARTRLREQCEKHGIPLANAVDPTARLAKGVRIGAGNVICAFCHLGVATEIGDNNFLSAYNSFDHHSRIGDDCSTGPGVMTSGLVELGSRVRCGTGIFVEPHLTIGDDAVIASGSVLVASVPADHIVKARAGASVVSPRRR